MVEDMREWFIGDLLRERSILMKLLDWSMLFYYPLY